ncbi:putative cyclophilin [Ascobolus immersus RN42]|uniref:Peptidyl-prolyl cis-trans isomerase n=1 Tax=Ascobolus immersus RN42 TaxID=1160509 RepID=A0A3N4IN44_ASCIM|nr:putative cyclophilin [Ascobolus immersus RN42]
MSVTLHTTAGPIKIEIFCEAVPKTAENFLALCASGYYDNCVIHRNIKAFILQTGDPTNTGKGGKSIYGEYFEDEINPALRHDKRGVVAMANKSKPNTNGSQFYITYAKAVHLDGKNTVFGKVIDGWDTLDEIEKGEVDKKYRPLKGTEVKIERVTMHANPLAG